MNLNDFNTQDIEEMKFFYQEELEKATRRLSHIQNILKKLDGRNSFPEQEIVSVNNKKDSPKKTIQKRAKKSGRPKSVFEGMVLKILRAQKKPLSYDKLTSEVMKLGQVPQKDQLDTRKKVQYTVRRIKTQKKKVDIYTHYNKERFVGLKAWFESPGDLKEEFKNIIQTKTVKKTGRKKVVITPKRHNSWTAYVLDFLTKANQPMLVKNMTLIAMDENEIDKKYYDKTRLAVARSLSDLVKNEKKVFSHLVNGKKPGFYGLTSWQDQTGKFRQDYLEKIKL